MSGCANAINSLEFLIIMQMTVWLQCKDFVFPWPLFAIDPLLVHMYINRCSPPLYKINRNVHHYGVIRNSTWSIELVGILTFCKEEEIFVFQYCMN